ncbi:DNA translocase FtsK [Legionella sp. W05-934-2]|jgi:S-DNA-T family DNA segregation ATPase FtsK/SpoIIIE|uniref:DNA translocase FtsK n=1 Tax=Legionella sp. W05-934-2 TaxID=1198649 RepID=UPI003462C06E
MGKNKTNTSSTGRSVPDTSHKRLIEGAFIIILCGALFVVLSLLTYNSQDSAWTHVGYHAKQVTNSGGQVGAYIADLMYWLYGYMAYIIPIGIAFVAWRVLQEQRLITQEHHSTLLLRTVGLIFLILGACGLLSMEEPLKPLDTLHATGGIIGDGVTAYLIQGLNIQGATLVLLAWFLVGVTWLTGLSWVKLSEWLGKLLFALLMNICKVVGVVVSALFLAIKSIFTRSEKPKQTSVHKPLIRKIEPSIKIVKETPDVTIAHEPIKLSKEAQPAKTIRKVKTDGSMPPLSLLDRPKTGKKTGGFSADELEHLSREVEQHLFDFGIQADVVAVQPGPVITRFELQLAAGIKVSKLTTLAKDLARSLSVISVRVVEVIPGKTVVGLELPNAHREIVRLSEVLEHDVYTKATSPLSLALGVDIAGQPTVVDLIKMPHLLVAGTTGSGKSVGINSMILSLLFKASPDDVRLVLVDPKMLELSVYDGIPHLLTPVVTDMKEAASALRWCVGEMERRYRLMAALGVRNIAGYNTKVLDAETNGEPIVDPLWKPVDSMEEEAPILKKLPYIVVVIDELADMMMVVGKKVEQLIARIAQKARAAGIHLILATQRPSVDVLTGLIKSNIPTRISFQVSSKIDSRTILDQQGADQLLGHGDMLYLPPGSGAPFRVHGAYVDDKEVHRVADAWRAKGQPDYIESITQFSTDNLDPFADPDEEGEDIEDSDPLYDEAVQFVLQSRKASISSVQRRLKVGYNRAARLIEEMERTGIVGPMDGGVREVLVDDVAKG